MGVRNVNPGAIVPTLAGLINLRNLTLTFDNAPMVLLSLTTSGNLTATADGLISQSGALSVAGNAGFNTTAAATLSSVNLANGSALTLGTSIVGGDLTMTTTGDLTLPGGQTLTVVGDTTLTTAGNVNLLGMTRIGGTQSSIGGTGSTFVLGADSNLNALSLPGTGNVTVNTTGTTATFSGGPLPPQAINLGNTSHSFAGSVSVTTAAPAFTGTNMNTYNLTQSAPVTLGVGRTLIVTDLGGTAGKRGNITSTNLANNFDQVNFTGGNIAWAETGLVTIGVIGVSANAGSTSTGTLTITSTGAITQTGSVMAAGFTTLTAGAANNITLANSANDFNMIGITSGTGAITYTAGTDVTLGSLNTGGGVNVSAGGSVLSAVGSGTNVTAGANSMLQAFNGIVGTLAASLTVNVNPGTLSIRATTVIAGISANLTGTVFPSNALTLLNVPPGLVCFNTCPVVVSNNLFPFGNFGFIPSFNRDSVIPWYLHEPSDPPLISVVSTYLPKTVVAEAETDVKSDDQSVARAIPPCFPESACKPGASVLTAPADGGDPELPAAK